MGTGTVRNLVQPALILGGVVSVLSSYAKTLAPRAKLKGLQCANYGGPVTKMFGQAKKVLREIQ